MLTLACVDSETTELLLSLTSLLFLAAYFSGCIAALVRHPVYGLVTYVLMLYLHPPSRWWGEALPDLRWSL